METLENVQSLDDIQTIVDGYYWNFPEVLYTWGLGLKYARLMRLQTDDATVYMRMRQTQTTIASWQGKVTPDVAKQVLRFLADKGLASVKFLPQAIDLKPALPGGYKAAYWHSTVSWKDLTLSQNRRWQFATASRRYEFVPVSKSSEDIDDALRILEVWVSFASQRQRLMGIGHYASCIKLHPELQNSVFFFCRKRGSTKNVGLVGGYVRENKAVITTVKHDYSDKFLIHALWGFWMDHIHRERNIPLSDNGSTSDDIKKRCGMERTLYYKPPRVNL